MAPHNGHLTIYLPVILLAAACLGADARAAELIKAKAAGKTPQAFVADIAPSGASIIRFHDRADLVKVADSLFTTVEATSPACMAETKPWRMAKPWQDRINAAFKFMAANEVDSAEFYAKSSQVLDRWSPYAPRVFAAIAQVRRSFFWLKGGNRG